MCHIHFSQIFFKLTEGRPCTEMSYVEWPAYHRFKSTWNGSHFNYFPKIQCDYPGNGYTSSAELLSEISGVVHNHSKLYGKQTKKYMNLFLKSEHLKFVNKETFSKKIKKLHTMMK